MTAIRSLVQVSLIAACAATSFVSAQVYVVAKADAQQQTAAAKLDAATVLADNGDRTKALSPIFPTTKYNLPPPPAAMATKPAKTFAAARAVKPAVKVTARPAAGRPMELAAYITPQPVTYGYAPEAPQPRAAGIFGHIR